MAVLMRLSDEPMVIVCGFNQTTSETCLVLLGRQSHFLSAPAILYFTTAI